MNQLKANLHIGSTEILDVASDTRDIVTMGTTKILNATRDVKETLVEFQSQVVQALGI